MITSLIGRQTLFFTLFHLSFAFSYYNFLFELSSEKNGAQKGLIVSNFLRLLVINYRILFSIPHWKKRLSWLSLKKGILRNFTLRFVIFPKTIKGVCLSMPFSMKLIRLAFQELMRSLITWFLKKLNLCIRSLYVKHLSLF